MSKKDNPSTRLAKAIARWNPPGNPSLLAPDVFKGISIPAGGWLSDSFWWFPVRDAFEAFGLDASSPRDWELLIYEFADAHFGKTRGRRPVWTDERLCRLAADFATAKAAHPGKLDEDIRKLLVKRSRYRKLDAETIRRRLPEARKLLAQTVARCRERVRRAQINLTPAQEQSLPTIVIETIANCDTDTALSFDFPCSEVLARVRGN